MSDRPLLTASQLATWLVIDARTVRRLARSGLLLRTGGARSRFDPAACVPAYIKHLRTGAGGATTLAEAKLQLTNAQRQKIDLQNVIKRGEVIYADQVGETLATLAADLAARHDGLPGRLAGSLAGMTDPAAIRALLQTELRTVRAAFAESITTMADQMGKAKD